MIPFFSSATCLYRFVACWSFYFGSSASSLLAVTIQPVFPVAAVRLMFAAFVIGYVFKLGLSRPALSMIHTGLSSLLHERVHEWVIIVPASWCPSRATSGCLGHHRVRGFTCGGRLARLLLIADVQDLDHDMFGCGRAERCCVGDREHAIQNSLPYLRLAPLALCHGATSHPLQ